MALYQDRGVEDVGLQALGDHDLARCPRLGLAPRRQADVGPPGEQVLQVPRRLPVPEQDHPVGHIQYLTTEANVSGSSEAPPTSAPLMFVFAMKSLMLAALTEPPYKIRIPGATSSEIFVDGSADRIGDRCGVVRLGVAPGPDGPDRLIGNCGIREAGGVDPVQCCEQLPGDHGLRFTRLALLEGLADTDDGTHPGADHRPHLLVHLLVGLTKELSPLGVADDHMPDRELGQHRSRDLTGEGT